MFSFYSDGSSDNVKLKNAGWASVLIFDNPERKPIVWYGHLTPPSTNNQGELLGIAGCIAMRNFLERKYDFTNLRHVINSDSEYAIGCLTKEDWNPTKNRDLINIGRFLLNESRGIIDLNWVKGHSKIVGNELADKFAGYGRNQQIVNDPRYATRYFKDKEECIAFFQTCKR